MDPKLRLARMTLRQLRKRRCVQRVIRLSLTVHEAGLLSDALASTTLADNDKNRPTILLCNSVCRGLRRQIAREQKHNEPQPTPAEEPVDIPLCSCGRRMVKWGNIWRCPTAVEGDSAAGIEAPLAQD